MSEMKILRVFTDKDNNFGNPLGIVIDEENSLDKKERQQITIKSGFSEVVFINNIDKRNISIYSPQGEIPFAGHAVVGTTYFLTQEYKIPITQLVGIKGIIKTWQENGLTWVKGKLSLTPPWNYEQLFSASSIKNICDEIGIKDKDIPLDDSDTMKIFSSTKTLNVAVKSYNLGIGTAGLPEYGSRFVRGLLAETKPKSLSDLAVVSGLSHGVDTWMGNAKDLIGNKTAKLDEVIALRDDVMIFLMSKGLDKEKAYEIMENVRKGKGLTDEDEKLMSFHDVPKWYFNSCNKIKYLFPKAHAIAYAIISFKMAYLKVHYPAYFYADYFNRKIKAFDYNLAVMSLKELENKIQDNIGKQGNGLKEREQIDMMEVIAEMKERGFDFAAPDTKKSAPVLFKAVDKLVIMPLAVVAGK